MAPNKPSISAPRPRTLVAAIGQPWLSDEAFGLCVLERLAGEPLEGVILQDLSCAMITAFQLLREQSLDRAIFVATVARGRPPGSLHCIRAADPLPAPAEIQARIADGVMGLVSLDNLIIMARYYGALPADHLRIELEPINDSWGDSLSPQVVPLVDRTVQMIRRELASPRAEAGR